MNNFDVNVAIKTIGQICKTSNISLSELRAQFPARPTTEGECYEIAAWLNRRIAKPSRPSLPQATLVEAQQNWVRRDKNGKAMPMYFAVEMDGKPHFFRVKPGYKSGVWFVEEQASDEMYPVNNRARRGRILGLIFQDAAKAQALYGQLIGRCARCHKTLTDHTNPYFAMGLGPECGSK